MYFKATLITHGCHGAISVQSVQIWAVIINLLQMATRGQWRVAIVTSWWNGTHVHSGFRDRDLRTSSFLPWSQGCPLRCPSQLIPPLVGFACTLLKLAMLRHLCVLGQHHFMWAHSRRWSWVAFWVKYTGKSDVWRSQLLSLLVAGYLTSHRHVRYCVIPALLSLCAHPSANLSVCPLICVLIPGLVIPLHSWSLNHISFWAWRGRQSTGMLVLHRELLIWYAGIWAEGFPGSIRNPACSSVSR